jgi:hypothetical protein
MAERSQEILSGSGPKADAAVARSDLAATAAAGADPKARPIETASARGEQTIRQMHVQAALPRAHPTKSDRRELLRNVLPDSRDEPVELTVASDDSRRRHHHQYHQPSDAAYLFKWLVHTHLTFAHSQPR